MKNYQNSLHFLLIYGILSLPEFHQNHLRYESYELSLRFDLANFAPYGDNRSFSELTEIPFSLVLNRALSNLLIFYVIRLTTAMIIIVIK